MGSQWLSKTKAYLHWITARMFLHIHSNFLPKFLYVKVIAGMADWLLLCCDRLYQSQILDLGVTCWPTFCTLVFSLFQQNPSMELCSGMYWCHVEKGNCPWLFSVSSRPPDLPKRCCTFCLCFFTTVEPHMCGDKMYNLKETLQVELLPA